MKTIRTASLHLSAPRKLALTLTVLGGLATAGSLAAATARADDGQPGVDAPHQERNPSQHPELFVFSANRGIRRYFQVEKITPAPRRAGPALRVDYTTLPSPVLPVKDDQPGTGAPHQERNPSQHPELFGTR